MTGRKFSKTKVVHKQKEKRKISKNFFRKNDLKVVIKWNLKFVNYLDVTLNLLNNTFNSFSKSNNEFNYLHKESNHPPCQTSTFFNRATLIKAFLFWILNESTYIYQEALKKSGYDYILKYQKNSSTTTSKQKRKRKIIFLDSTKLKTVWIKITTFFKRCVSIVLWSLQVWLKRVVWKM